MLLDPARTVLRWALKPEAWPAYCLPAPQGEVDTGDNRNGSGVNHHFPVDTAELCHVVGAHRKDVESLQQTQVLRMIPRQGHASLKAQIPAF